MEPNILVYNIICGLLLLTNIILISYIIYQHIKRKKELKELEGEPMFFPKEPFPEHIIEAVANAKWE